MSAVREIMNASGPQVREHLRAVPDTLVERGQLMHSDTSALDDYSRARVAVQPNGCWHWTGSINRTGYGVANRGARGRTGAHRYVYRLVVGEIPAGLGLDHQCHNLDDSCPGGICLHRRCVNPDHLEPVTTGVNVRRGKTPPGLNLLKTHCPAGHEYDRVDERGWRKCRTCENARLEARRRANGQPLANAWAPECPHGHAYTPENTRWSKRGYRHCKTCDLIALRKRRAANPTPCHGCGQPKPKAKPGSWYCLACFPNRGAA